MFNPVVIFFLISFLLCAVGNVLALTVNNELSDPTRPAAVRIMQTENTEDQQAGGQNYNVSQIYISQKTQMAIINGQKVKMGDSIGGAEVLAIKSGSVSLLVDGSITEITIIPSIKQYKK